MQPSLFGRYSLIVLAFICIPSQDIFGQTAIRCVPRSITPGPSYGGGYFYYYPKSYSSTYSSGYGTINGEPVYNNSSGTVNGVPSAFPANAPAGNALIGNLPMGNAPFGNLPVGNIPVGDAPTVRTGTSSSTSTSRSVSFKKDGKTVSIRETPSGITAKIGGKTIRAKNLGELQQKSPEAYELYNERMGTTFAKASASGRASAGGGAGGGPGIGAPLNVKKSDSSSRSVTVAENGTKVTITENDGVIIVRANGRTIRAKSLDELGVKSPDALRLYKEHFTDAAPAIQAPANQGPGFQGPGAAQANAGPVFGNDAREMLRGQIDQMRQENQGNAQMQGMFDQMLRQLDE